MGFYPDEESAAEATARLRRERYFRSALVSVSDKGRRTVRHTHVILLFAGLIAFLFLAVSLYTRYWGHHPWYSTALLVFGAYAFAFIVGPRVGLALPRSVYREYEARVLPGETMVIAQCRSPETRHVRDLLQNSENSNPAVFVIRPYLEEPFRGLRQERELLSAEQLRSYATRIAEEQIPRPVKTPEVDHLLFKSMGADDRRCTPRSGGGCRTGAEHYPFSGMAARQRLHHSESYS